jgi:hypothetical protein
LIVTNGGDSLNVKIVEELSAAIFYDQPNKYGKIAQQRMFKTLIKDFKYNYYKKENQTDSRIVEESRGENNTSDYEGFMRFRLGFDIGYWQLIKQPTLGSTPFENYLKKLNKGGNFIFQAGFFPFERIGVGAKYHRFGAANNLTTEIEYLDFDKSSRKGTIRDNTALHFIAPVLYLRQALNYKTYATLGLSGGTIYYRNNAFRTEKILLKSNGWGLGADLGVDLLQGNTAIGFDSGISLTLHYLYTNLKQIDFVSAKKNDSQLFTQDFSRFGATIGIKFYKIPKYLKLTSY